MLQRRARGLDVSPVRVIRGYDRKSKVLTGVAADAKPTIHDGTAKAFVYSGLFDCVEMKTEWNRDHHRICKSACMRTRECIRMRSTELNT
jgi:hypothetical protein